MIDTFKFEEDWEEFEEEDIRTKAKNKLIEDCNYIINRTKDNNEKLHYEKLKNDIVKDNDNVNHIIDNVIKYKLYK